MARRGKGIRVLGAVCAAIILCGLSVPSGAFAEGGYLSAFGPDGTEVSDFEVAGPVAVDQQTGSVYVADTEGGFLYKFGPEGEAVPFSGSAPYISGNRIEGLSFGEATGRRTQVAVNSKAHLIYVTTGNAIRVFDESGEPVPFTAGPGQGTSELNDFAELAGVAVDSLGNIYASDNSPETVKLYAPSGRPITEFDAGVQPANLAVSPEGAVYVTRFLEPVRKFTPSEFPPTAETSYVAAPQSLNENGSFSVAVDPLTGFVYVSEVYPAFGTSRVAVYDENDAFVGSFGGPGEPGELQEYALGVAVNGTNQRVYVSSTAGGEPYAKVEIFEGFSIPELAPAISNSSATDVTADSAILHANINPNTLPTTYFFEYGLADCASASSSCSSVPLGGGTAGSGRKPVAVQQLIGGLEAGTTYHFRVVAQNAIERVAGPDRTFTTQPTFSGFSLSDSRVWEMVSPPKKFSGTLRPSSAGAIQAAADGSALAYLSIGPLESDPEGNRANEASVVLAKRVGQEWRSKDITPPHAKTTSFAAGTEYNVFSPTLGAALLEPRDNTPLSPEASERAPYLRVNDEPPLYTPLVTGKGGFANVPPGTEFGGDEHGDLSVWISAASADLSHAVLTSAVPLSAGARPFSLYEWSGGALEPINLLPAGEGGGYATGGVALGSDQGSVSNAISSDGKRVFWSTGEYGANGIHLTGLYMRDTSTDTSVRLDVAQAGATGFEESLPVFVGASADGTVVYFSDSQQLTADASPEGRDLYRCQIPEESSAGGCASLVDVTAPRAGLGESAEQQGIAPAISEDGSSIFFVARGVLDSSPNGRGEAAIPGGFNLYHRESGGSPRFIATLDAADGTDWGTLNGVPGYTSRLTANASPSGRYLAFMSTRSLTGYTNEDASSQQPTEEVYLYDTTRDELSCPSCNPSGARPRGAQSPPFAVDASGLWQGRWVSADLPEATVSMGKSTERYPAYRPRTVLDNGRVFFNASDGLVSADSNQGWDVYQYEPISVGNCSASSSSAAMVRSGAGCVSLMSSGTAGAPVSFLDSSLTGDDVFFLTSKKLAMADEDDVNDVYDARVNGVQPVRAPVVDCVGSACLSTPEVPAEVAPASSIFEGPGNVRSKAARHRCPKAKHKVRRHGKTRCVRRSHGKHGQGRKRVGPTARGVGR